MKKLLSIILFLQLAKISLAVITEPSTTSIAATQPAEIYTFAFTFFISFIGSYLLYGILAGPAAVAGVYIITKDKRIRKFAWYGCIIGTLIGLTLKIIALS